MIKSKNNNTTKMIVIKDNKFYFNNKEISYELFTFKMLDASEGKTIKINLKPLKIKIL